MRVSVVGEQKEKPSFGEEIKEAERDSVQSIKAGKSRETEKSSCILKDGLQKQRFDGV